MPDNQSDYQVGPGRPPLHTRFKKGQSGHPGGRSIKTLPALLATALDERIYVTANGGRRKIFCSICFIMSISTLVARREGPRHRTIARTGPARRGGQEVVQLFVGRLRSQMLQKIDRRSPICRPSG